MSIATLPERLSKVLAFTDRMPIDDVRQMALDICKEHLPPKEPLTISDWADTYRVIGFGTSAEPGQWRTDRVPYMREPMDRLLDETVEEIIFCSSAQVSKALAVTTPLPTPNGWTTMGDVQPGDIVFDEQGQPTRVLGVTEFMHDRPCWELTFSDNSKIVCDEEHLWTVDYEKHGVTAGSKTITTAEIVTTYKTGKRNNYAIPLTKSLKLPKIDLPIDPYVLGIYLGDGHRYSGQITCNKDDALEISQHIIAAGHKVETKPDKTCQRIVIDPYIPTKYRDHCLRGHVLAEVGLNKVGRCKKCASQDSSFHRYRTPKDPLVQQNYQTFSGKLRQLGLISGHELGNNPKFIPVQYLRASSAQRLALLQGLMDTDGDISTKGRPSFTTTSKPLAENFGELLSSLGIKYTLRDYIPTTTYKGQRVNGARAYRFSFMVYRETPIFRLRRQLSRQVSSKKAGRRPTETWRRRIVNCQPFDSVPVKCIRVDSPSHLYLAGKTMIPTHNTENQLNLTGYFIHHDPSPQLFVLPDEPTCTELSRDRFEPMVQATPVLKELVSDYKGRGSENTKFVKRFPGGRLNFVGAQSPSQLSSKPIRVVQIDELDRCNANCEGDIYSLARTRTTTFRNRKLFITSTPTLKDASPIWSLYESTEQHKYHVPCPGCKVSQVLVWSQVKWEGKGKNRNTWYECPHCQHHWTESERLRAVQKGEWKPTAQSQSGSEKRRGYHLWAAYSPFVTLDELAASFLKCGKDKLKLQVFVNTVLGECWEDPDAQKLDYQELWQRAENYDALTVPKGGLLLTAGIDCQKDRLAIVVRAWGLGEESWLVYATELFGDIEKDEPWNQLSELLEAKFTHESGQELPIECSFIDSSAFTQTVYNRVRNLSRKFNIKPSKGSSVETTPIIVRPSSQDVTVSGKVIKGGIKLWPVGVYGAKRQFMARLRFTEGAGTYHWYQVGEDYFQQICSESLQTRYVKGFAKQEWVLAPGVRNEFLDCEIYALAALYSMGCSHKGFWSRWEKRLADTPVKTEEEVAPKRRAVRREPKKGWMKK